MSEAGHREAAAAEGATTARRGRAPVSAIASSWPPSMTLSPAFSAAC
jgi:hypothetical protein